MRGPIGANTGRQAHGAASPDLMLLYWIVYRNDELTTVQIVPAYSLMEARLRADMATPGIGAHTVEGHELDEATAARVPKSMIGRRLTTAEAAKLLERIARR